MVEQALANLAAALDALLALEQSFAVEVCIDNLNALIEDVETLAE